MAKEKLVLSTEVAMCSGIGCPKKDQCYRYMLNHFFDVIARTPHPYPEFVEPKKDCKVFVKTQYME